jgi:RsiW-degrading membrane proteinase PrsW (M82 family)
MEQLFIAIFSLLPALFYAYIVYITMPFKSINLADGFRFLIAGIFSVIILKYLSVVGLTSTLPYAIFSGDMSTKTMGYKHYQYFISVGLMEEVSKLIAFFVFANLMSWLNKDKLHPIAIMFYCGMVGLGFAVAENVHYANGAMQPFNMLWWRSIAPVLTHMTCGFFMGYWISLSRIGPRMYNRSLFDIIIHKRPVLNKVIYTMIGLFCATILHGVYDLHLDLNGISGLSGAYVLIILSSLGVLYCFNHIYIVNKNREIQETNGEEGSEKDNKEKSNKGRNVSESYKKGFSESQEICEDDSEEKTQT